MTVIRWLDDLPAQAGDGPMVWITEAAADVGLGRLAATAADQADACRHPGPALPDFLRRRRLLRRLAASWLGVAAESVVVGYDAAGAPRLIEPQGRLWISTASRDGWLALAIAPVPVGVDVEVLSPSAEPAWAMLAPAECAALAAEPEASRWPAFLRLWTAKEAYLKALRLGLVREPSDIAISFSPDGSFSVRDRERPVIGLVGAHKHLAIDDTPLLVACAALPAETKRRP